MKKILLFAAIAALACSCGQRTGYTIDGKIEGFDEKVVYMSDETGAVIDSAKVKGGKFRFKGTAEEPFMVNIDSGEGALLAVVILENGSIKITGNIEEPESVRITGTPSNDGSTELMIRYFDLMERYSSAGTDEERAALIAEEQAVTAGAVDDNLDNFFGLAILNNIAYSMETDEVLEKLGKFPQEIQNTKLGREVREQAEAKQRIATGQPYMDIALPDKDGNRTAISSYVGPGKYVLISFWASWCGQCIMQIPYMKDAYDTYHKKGFEIFSVSLDGGRDAEGKWLDAVDKHGMNWVNVAWFKEPENTATTDYYVTMIPANFLISPEGIIIAKNLSQDGLKRELAKYIE
jgi:peroxiredoxin